MAGQDGSSEELVEDDSGEEEYQQEDESSASFDSEEDEGGDDADDFETPQKARKRRRAAPTPDPGPKTPRRTPTRIPTTANTNTSSSKNKARNATLKNNAVKEAVATGGKGKGRAPTKAPPEASSSLSTPSGNHLEIAPGEESETDPPLPGTASTGAGGASGSGSGSGRAPVSSSISNTAGTSAATTSAITTGSKNPNPGTTGPAPAKTPKAAVSDYMLQSNRPYSCINVFDNLRKKIPKPMVQKLLDELTRDGTLKMQEYGKAKIYYANQMALPNGAGDVSAGKMQTLEQDVKDLTSKLEAASAQAREAQSKANSLSAQPSDTSLDEMLASTALDLERMEAKNAAAKGQGRGNVPGGMKAAKASANKYRALWLARKRNAMDVVDMICDGMDKKPKAVMDMIGLEPDEDSVPAKM